MNIDIGIEPDARKQISEGMCALLANSYTLYLKTHNYHWNVTGPHFTILHEMFETHYTELANAVDEIAERIRTLGFKAPGSYSAFAELSSIQEETDHPDANQMVAQLVADHETIVRIAREQTLVAADAGDEGSIDILTQRIHLHEKTAWMLRSLIES